MLMMTKYLGFYGGIILSASRYDCLLYVLYSTVLVLYSDYSYSYRRYLVLVLYCTRTRTPAVCSNPWTKSTPTKVRRRQLRPGPPGPGQHYLFINKMDLSIQYVLGTSGSQGRGDGEWPNGFRIHR